MEGKEIYSLLKEHSQRLRAKDKNTFNPYNPEHMEIVERLNEQLNSLWNERLPKDEKLRQITDMIAHYKSDLEISKDCPPKTYKENGKTISIRLYNEGVLMFIIKQLKIFKKRFKTQPETSVIDINPEYETFWMQFTKTNPKTGKPYMTKKEVVIFLKQAFGGSKVEKTFKPGKIKTQIQHGAHLFFHNYDFTKTKITRILIKNFPVLFDKDNFQNEYDNVKNRPHKNRIFQYPPIK